ncbi:unnamed protein product [Staurois parvus]|uniref:Uncharacterized protein n=1 Tax=Staurois parvus TaxID=386267 RepID=A0ABN9BYI8_9NEOB|nr:unnamed protein product [Staurois parvus]
MGPLCPCPNSKKPMKKVPGASHGPPTDPGPRQCPSFQMVSPPLVYLHFVKRCTNCWRYINPV